MRSDAQPPDETPADLAARRDALRQAAGIPGADPAELLDAVLAELDGALAVIAAREAAAEGPDDGGAGSAGPAERRLLQAAFQRAPVPLLMLERDGTIRRANARAAELVGIPVGYAAGKPLSAFLDPASRAATATQLAAVLRTGAARQARCRVLSADGPLSVTLTASVIAVPGEQAVLMAAITAGPGPAAPPPAGRPGRKGATASGGAASGSGSGGTGSGGRSLAGTAPDPVVRAMTRRMDLIAGVARVLLDNATFSEAVTLRRVARLLAGELASWVIIDIERDGRLRRQVVAGPASGPSGAVRDGTPGPGTVAAQVHASGQPVLLAHADDAGLLGPGPDGTPLLLALGVTSLACVPIEEGNARYGTMTLARLRGEPSFDLADLGLAEQLGGHLAVAMRVARMFRRRSQEAEALQASLLPARLPQIGGLELAPAYLGATGSAEVSGDFYDVFRAGDGWAAVIGDVCGKGHGAAAMTAAARHALRALALSQEGPAQDDPAQLLARVNEVLLAEEWTDRFVTVSLAVLSRHGRQVRARIASAGHPGPAVVRADGRVEVLECGGLPLGLFPDVQPGVREVDLASGDLLFCYTDGVTEARDGDQSYFDERLADELAAMAGRAAADAVRAVSAAVTTFSGADLRDDVTMLAIRVG